MCFGFFVLVDFGCTVVSTLYICIILVCRFKCFVGFVVNVWQ
jgi:hypothetical protein